ncbi:MAG: hypothetical protein LBI14_03850 [Treponema sp.]|jgi:hypothetical protein|nr:hypothetical protein [Treponema sp.]
MGPREKELIGKIFKDKDGKPYQDVRFLQVPNRKYATGYMVTVLNFRDGKLHGSPAIVYPDGWEEDWEDGNFIKVSRPPYNQEARKEFEKNMVITKEVLDAT